MLDLKAGLALCLLQECCFRFCIEGVLEEYLRCLVDVLEDMEKAEMFQRRVMLRWCI